MRTEDLFKFGVTPKEGPYAGMQFKVTAITPTVIKATLYDGDKAMDEEFTHGSYDLWQPPKTLFEDRSIEATIGELKKAIEAYNLPDDTPIYTEFFTGLGVRSGMFSLITPFRDGKKAILVE